MPLSVHLPPTTNVRRLCCCRCQCESPGGVLAGPGMRGGICVIRRLKERPFTLVPDPDFLFWSPAHRRAYAMLEYGLFTKAPITLITGEVGAGKTTLLHHLLKKLDDDVSVGLISNAHGDRGELLRWVLMALGQDEHQFQQGRAPADHSHGPARIARHHPQPRADAIRPAGGGQFSSDGDGCAHGAGLHRSPA